MRVYPSNSHEIRSKLGLKKFNFIIHAALILLACLSGHDQRCNVQLTLLFNARQNSTSFNFSGRIRVGHFEEFLNNLDRTHDSSHSSDRLKWSISGRSHYLGRLRRVVAIRVRLCNLRLLRGLTVGKVILLRVCIKTCSLSWGIRRLWRRCWVESRIWKGLWKCWLVCGRRIVLRIKSKTGHLRISPTWSSCGYRSSRTPKRWIANIGWDCWVLWHRISAHAWISDWAWRCWRENRRHSSGWGSNIAQAWNIGSISLLRKSLQQSLVVFFGGHRCL